MVDNDTRLRELSNRAADGSMTDEDFAELAQLSMAKKKVREARADLIAGVRETLRNQGLAIHDLFSEAEIAAAVPQRALIGRRVVRKSQGRAPDAPGAEDGRRESGNGGKGPRKGGVLFAPGECRALIQQVLHETSAALTATELVLAVAEKKSLPATDEASVRLAVYYILRKKNNADFVVVDPQATRARWTVVK